MSPTPASLDRRAFLASAAVGTLVGRSSMAGSADQARVAITFDLEMSANFPRWEDTHWNYEKGNLDSATKQYSVEAARRVRGCGSRIHFFCVGRVLEQEDVSWLVQLATDGHPVGNHTYDHVNVLATRLEDLQARFKRSPWLVEGQSPVQMIRENIRLTTVALKERAGIANRGFRTPGGYANGLDGHEDVQRMLLDLGFAWVSSKYPRHAIKPGEPSAAIYRSIVEAQPAAQPYVYPTGLVEVPISPVSDIAAFRTGRWRLEWFLEAVRQGIAWSIEHRAVFDFLAHPSCLGVVDPKFRTIDLICQLVEESAGRARLVDLDAIAKEVAK